MEDNLDAKNASDFFYGGEKPKKSNIGMSTAVSSTDTSDARLASDFFYPEPVKESTVPEDTGDFMRGLKATYEETIGTVQGARALASSGAERERLFESYQSRMDAGAAYDRLDDEGESKYSFSYLSDKGSVGDWADAFQYYLGAGAANVIGGGGAGFVSKQVGKQAVKGAVAAGVGIGAKAGARITTGSALAGTGALAVTQTLGSTFGRAGEEQLIRGNTLEDVDDAKVVAYGTAAGLFEFGADLVSLGAVRALKLPSGSMQEFSDSVLGSRRSSTVGRVASRGAKGFAAGVIAEGLITEPAQVILERLGADMTVDFGDPELQNELIEAGFAGALTGGGIAGTVNAVAGKNKNKLDPATPSEREMRAPPPEEAVIQDAPTSTESVVDTIGATVGLDRESKPESDLTSAERKQRKEVEKSLEDFFNSKTDKTIVDPDTQEERTNVTVAELIAYRNEMAARKESLVLGATQPSEPAPNTSVLDTIESSTGLNRPDPLTPAEQKKVARGLEKQSDEYLNQPTGRILLDENQQEVMERVVDALDRVEADIFEVTQTHTPEGTDTKPDTQAVIDRNVGLERSFVEPSELTAEEKKERNKRRAELREGLRGLDDPSGVMMPDPETQVERELTVKEAIELQIQFAEQAKQLEAMQAMGGKYEQIAKDLESKRPFVYVNMYEGASIDGVPVEPELIKVPVTVGSMDYVEVLRTQVKTPLPKQATKAPADKAEVTATAETDAQTSEATPAPAEVVTSIEGLSKGEQKVFDAISEAFATGSDDDINNLSRKNTATAVSPAEIAKKIGSKTATVSAQLKRIKTKIEKQSGMSMSEYLKGIRTERMAAEVDVQETDFDAATMGTDVADSETSLSGGTINIRSEGQSASVADTAAKAKKSDFQSMKSPTGAKQALNSPETMALGKSFFDATKKDSKQEWDSLSDDDKLDFIADAYVSELNAKAQMEQDDAMVEPVRPENEGLIADFKLTPIGETLFGDAAVMDGQLTKAGLPKFDDLDSGLQRMVIETLVESRGINLNTMQMSDQASLLRGIRDSVSKVEIATKNPDANLAMVGTAETDTDLATTVIENKDKPDGIFTILDAVSQSMPNTDLSDVVRKISTRMKQLVDAGLDAKVFVEDSNSRMRKYIKSDMMPIGMHTISGDSERGFTLNVVLKGTDDETGSGLNSEVIAHESLHAVTHAVVRMVQNGLIKDPDVVAAVKALEKQRIEAMKLYAKYSADVDTNMDNDEVMHALKNEDELLAYTYTSSDFNKLLKDLEAADTKANAKPKKLVQRIFETIARIVKLPFSKAKSVDTLSAMAREIRAQGEVVMGMDADALVGSMNQADQDTFTEAPLQVVPEGSQEAPSPKSDNLLGRIALEAKAIAETGGKAFQLGWMTLEQIRTRYKYPEVDNYVRTTQAIERDQKDRLNDAHKVVSDWATISEDTESAKQLDYLMVDTTMATFDPTVDTPSNEYQTGLKARYDALPQPFKDMYVRVRDYYQADMDAKLQVMEDLKLSAQADGTELKGLTKILADTRQRKGPYFPLQRLGKFYAVGMSQKLFDLEKKNKKTPLVGEELKEYRKLRRSPKHYRTESFDSAATAKLREAELAKDFDKAYYNKTSEVFGAEAQSTPDIDRVISYLQEDSVLDAKQMDGVRSTLLRLYADVLPDATGVSSMLRRENIAGADTDMRRVFANVAMSNASRTSRIRHAKDLNQATRELKSIGDFGNKEGRAIANELAKRSGMVYDEESGAVVNTLMAGSYYAHLGLNPSYLLLNMSQTPMITMPWLYGRYDAGAVASELSSSWLKDASEIIKTSWSKGGWRMELDWNDKFQEGSNEDRMLKEMLARNKIDVTMEHDLIAMSEGSTEGIGAKATELMQMGNTPVRVIEMSNRVGTALTTYRLESAKLRANTTLDDSQIHDQAVEMAARAINETQLDYSSMNTPRYMQSVGGSRALARIMFQFRKFQQGMVYLTVSNLYDAVKGQSPEVKREARRTLTGLFTTTGLMAGSVGLPMAGLVFTAVDAADWVGELFGEEDEDDLDAETEFKNYLTDLYGADVARVITKGLPAAVGADISSRIGLGDIASPLPFARMGGDKPSDDVKELAFSAMGAPVGYLARVADGAVQIAEGDVARGFESVIPIKGIQNLLKTYRYSDEGVTTSKGEPIFTKDNGLDAWDLTLQAIGFAPDKLTRYYEANNAMYTQQRNVSNARQDLITAYAQAKLDKDAQGVERARADIQAFNRRNKQNRKARIKPKDLNSSIRNRYDARKQRDAVGRKTNKQMKPYLEAGKFAGDGDGE